MEGNLPLMISIIFVKIMESRDNFHLQELLNRMELLKGKKNVQEAARTMLNEAKLPDTFWRDAVYTSVHKIN
jgi:urease gamma subunit